MPEKIYLYGAIGEDPWDPEGAMTAARFTRLLDEMGDADVDILVNSPGGDVFDGVAIHTAIARHRGHVRAFVDGLAASAASYCILSADEVLVAPGALMMVHEPFMTAVGTAEELRQSADLLDRIAATITSIYASKTGMDPEDVAELLGAETWLAADEAIALGFADSLCEPRKVDARYSPEIMARYRNVPACLMPEEAPACNAGLSIDGGDEGQTRIAEYLVINGTVYEKGPSR